MYEQAFSAAADDDETGICLSLPLEFRDAFPNLATALSGKCGSKKAGTRAIPPSTIILFCRDGGVGFVIAPKDAPKNAHGYVSNPGNLTTQIEDELEAGRIGWKPPSKKRS